MTRQPAEVFHPGVHLRDELEARGLENFEYQRYTFGTYFDEILGIMYKDKPITKELADVLSRRLDTSPDYWLNLQNAWDEFKKGEE